MSNPLRLALPSDAEFVHANLKTVLVETFGQAPEFVAHELSRFPLAYLRALINAKRGYVFIIESEGSRAGFMLSGPEQGNLVLYWSFVDPAFRKGGLAISCMSQYVRHWDNNRFHKITSYTTEENRVAQLLMRRNGFQEVAKLSKHILGQDFMQFERHMNKVLPGYDKSVSLNLREVFIMRLKAKFKRA